LFSPPFWRVKEAEEVEVLKELLVVILLFCCGIPGSTPLDVLILLLAKALLLSEGCGAIEDAATEERPPPLAPIPIAVVASKGLEAVDISGVEEAEKSSPG
jgi:hypothetical protein